MYNSILILLVAHFVADYVFQSDEMAQKKSSSMFWLFIHVGIYSAVLWPFAFILLGYDAAMYVIVNFTLHFTTDFFTSRGTAYLYKRDRHWFFVLLGFDQLIHLVCLVKTFEYMR